ncbi:hypothetical protein [Streptomyces sp. SBT349]|uniref:hypothetical protein n=1 Tax=Streptomyces sp. SBT349 TaxID=1580539 RepID=UPI000AC9191F|nr:hypothetical protein [Streptomyces sp. SBT349]
MRSRRVTPLLRQRAVDTVLREAASGSRANGARGWWARWAWRRVVLACAAGDPAAQDAVRGVAAELVEADVRDLLAAAPRRPAERAAYLTLIGQRAQRRALDPDGTLLAVAYRAADSETRGRLRAAMAAEGDPDVARVVVVGEARDRIAGLSYDELDHLAHQLAEHRRWAELRRLTRDLPLAKAVAAASLLPPRERSASTGDGAVDFLPTALSAQTDLSAQAASRLRATVGRLPRERLLTHQTGGHALVASFSPDSSELALKCGVRKKRFYREFSDYAEFEVETLTIATGEATHRFGERTAGGYDDAVLHLGDEILVRLTTGSGRCSVVRVAPDHQVLCAPSDLSGMRRSGNGAVMLCRRGLALAEPGADRLRYVPLPWFSERNGGPGLRGLDGPTHTPATLPGSRLIAFEFLGQLYVVGDNGQGVLHTAPVRDRSVAVTDPLVLFFLSPHALALNFPGPYRTRRTEVWEFPPGGGLRRTAEHVGEILDRWPVEEWRGRYIDDAFARLFLFRGPYQVSPWFGCLDDDLPWPQGPGGTSALSRVHGVRGFLTTAPWGDAVAVATQEGLGAPIACEVHSPHLPAAREQLERPMLHATPGDLQRVHELRTRIGDPAVREALDVLAGCLGDRLGGEIALGSGEVLAPYSDTDLALGRDPEG